MCHLLSNAMKFTPCDGILKVEFTLEKDDKMGVVVADTGVGIDEGSLEKVGIPFVQVGSSHNATHYPGIGLGLATAKQAIALWGGEFCLKSEKGNGTVIAFSVPFGTRGWHGNDGGSAPEGELGDAELETVTSRVEACVQAVMGHEDRDGMKDRETRDEAEAAEKVPVQGTSVVHATVESMEESVGESSEISIEKPKSRRKKKDFHVFCADDQKMVRMILANIFSRMKIKGVQLRVEMFNDGDELVDGVKEFMNQHEQTPPELIVTDIHMPKMNGFDAIAHISAIVSNTSDSKKPHIVILTADSSCKIVRDGIDFGVDDVLVKPVSKKDIKRVVKACIKSIRAPRNAPKGSEDVPPIQ
jgi:CheY-like chemotaxis protein